MITVETGIPGSGKTLYCVDKLIRPLLNSTIKHEDADGVVHDVPRRVFSNINGLLLKTLRGARPLSPYSGIAS